MKLNQTLAASVGCLITKTLNNGFTLLNPASGSKRGRATSSSGWAYLPSRGAEHADAI